MKQTDYYSKRLLLRAARPLIVLAFAVLLLSLALDSCKKEEKLYAAQEEPIITSEMVGYLNSNIKTLQQLADAYLKEEKIVSFHESQNAYDLYFSSGERLRFIKMNTKSDVTCPNISMVQNDSVFLWTLNGRLLLDPDDGSPLLVGSSLGVPNLKKEGESWYCQKHSMSSWESVDDMTMQTIRITGKELSRFVIIALPTGCTLVFPKESTFQNLDDHVPNRAFFRDVFMDAGIGLANRTRLGAVSHLGVSFDYVNFTSDDQEDLQNQVFEGNEIDYNGRLLFPDGQPRFRVLFVVGGSSMKHGKSLSDEARDNMRKFYMSGGSYIGTCAGSSFASLGFDYHYPELYPYYLHIFPQYIKKTHVSSARVGFIIDPDSPLLNYYDFGGDFYVDSISHTGGNYADTLPPGAEVLARYDYPSVANMHHQPSAWAYKDNETSGRVIQTGSHPEGVWEGERMEFTAAMILYAFEGQGSTVLKGSLQNGIQRDMTKSTLDNDPDYTMIGDRQCHHFMVYIPQEAIDISFKLSSEADVDLKLMLNKNEFAYPDNATYVSEHAGANQNLCFSKLSPGLWYVSVMCKTTIKLTETDWGYEYTGRTDVLNGVPYHIRVNWTTYEQEEVLHAQ